MIYLSSKEISIFEQLIGWSIVSFSSDMMDVHEGSISFLKLSLRISFFKQQEFKSILFLSEFYETQESGSVYHDYHIIPNVKDPRYEVARFSLKTSPIKKISIYGKEIPSEHRKELSPFNNLFRNAKKTDNVFVFQLLNGEKVLIEFGSFLPQIHLYFSNYQIRRFWVEHQNNLKLFYTL